MKIHGNHWISWFLVIFKNYLFYKHVLTAHSVQIPQNIHRDERLPSVPTLSARAQIMGVVWTEQDESIWKMGKIRKIIKNHEIPLIFIDFWSFFVIFDDFPWGRCSSLDLRPPMWCITHHRKSFPDMKQSKHKLSSGVWAWKSVQ